MSTSLSTRRDMACLGSGITISASLQNAASVGWASGSDTAAALISASVAAELLSPSLFSRLIGLRVFREVIERNCHGTFFFHGGLSFLVGLSQLTCTSCLL
ncbi:MAG: hypothetical protein OXP71_06840 [Candidatus Poribacteria bacterium]|nr:hypothetical protein [Candidatus Poribacteria bacterium]